MKKVILMLVLVVLVTGCATEKVPESPINEEADIPAAIVTPPANDTPPADVTPPVNAAPVESNVSNKTTTPVEKPMQKGTVDPAFVLEKYDSEKAMDGTTLFPDNHDSTKPRIVEVNMRGEVIWQYYVPQALRTYTNPGFDVERLPNNNILFVLPGNGVYEIDRDGKVVWSYKTTKISHDADRLPNGNTLFAFGRNDKISDPQVQEINPEGEVVWSWYAKSYFDTAEYRSISIEGWSHTNAVSRMSNGDTLVSLRNFNLLAEVSPDGKVVKTIGKGMMTKQHDPAILPNGNILFADHATPNKAIEIDNDEKIVWEYTIAQPLWPARDVNRLPNGNTLITGTRKIIEITPDKEVVWILALKDTSSFTQQTAPAYGFYKAERITK
jgi:hypothetical protein